VSLAGLWPSGQSITIDRTLRRIYVTLNEERRLAVFDADSLQDIWNYPSLGFPGFIAVDETSHAVYVPTGLPNVVVIDGSTNKILPTNITSLPEFAQGAAVDAGAKHAYVGSNQGLLYVIDTTTHQLINTLDFPRPSNCNGCGLTVDPVRHRLYYAAFDGLIVLDTMTDKVVADWAVSTSSGIVVDPERQHLYLASPLGLLILDTSKLDTASAGGSLPATGGPPSGSSAFPVESAFAGAIVALWMSGWSIRQGSAKSRRCGLGNAEDQQQLTDINWVCPQTCR
jgi:DNA-binding beta-propeller fold protein YncE